MGKMKLQLMLVLWPLLAVGFATVVAGGRSPEECRAKGFDADSLLCGTCPKLEEATSAEVGQECLECCHSPYRSVVLSATQVAFMRNNGLSDFVTNRKQKFARGVVEFEMSPQQQEQAKLILVPSSSDQEGGRAETVRITHWSANDIEDYIAQFFPRVA